MDNQVSIIILRGILAYYESLSVKGSAPYSEVRKLIALCALNEMLCWTDECNRKRIYNIMMCMIGKSCFLPFPGTGGECTGRDIDPRITQDSIERVTEDENFWRRINTELQNI